MELVIDIADMRTDRADADTVFVRDLFIAEAVYKGIEDLVLPDGELVILTGGGGGGLEGLDDPAGDAGSHGGAPMVEVQDGLDDLPGGCFFEKITRGAGTDGIEDLFIIVKYSEHHGLYPGEISLYGAYALDTGNIG